MTAALLYFLPMVYYNWHELRLSLQKGGVRHNHGNKQQFVPTMPFAFYLLRPVCRRLDFLQASHHPNGY